MPLTLQITAIMLTAVAMCTALAHTLELPGKLRLSKEAYRTVQPIYYPGFTIAGVGEGLAIVSAVVLLFLIPVGSAAFRWTAIGAIALVMMHAAYWIVTHPVNRFWLQDQQLSGAGGGFFGFDPIGRRGNTNNDEDHWLRYRNRWEYSHLVRAALSFVALLALVIAAAL